MSTKRAIWLAVLGSALLGATAVSQDKEREDDKDNCAKPVATAAVGSSTEESPFACDRLALNAEQRKRHFGELGQAVVASIKSVRELPNGYEFEFAPEWSTIQNIGEFVAGERLCCPFFDINIRLEREHGSVWLRFTGREGTKQFIRTEGASWFKNKKIG